MKNIKVWKKIKKSNYKSIKHLLNDLIKKGHVLSPWIIDIFNNKKNNILINNQSFNLYKIKVKNLGFKKATKLKYIYKKILLNNYDLVTPDLALRTRFFYKEQKTGEWLRFATPFNSMIDTDKVPHLPKLGRALQKYFIETYWSYPDAIFHPHNEFIITKK
tara:strand:- start:1382 stop:1864 length:483 start_codon:yes stop_codon:yes gene_type:complete